MSNYAKITDFAIKDGLPSGDPSKKVRGSEIDAEFEALETAVNSKVDASSGVMTGTPTAPTAAASTDTTQIATTAHVKTAIALAFQGMIVLWSGAEGAIPTGWVLCDGTNSTPDLRDRFVVGAGTSYAVGATGGANSVASGSDGSHSHGGATGNYALTVAQIPAHSHTTTHTYHANNSSGASAQGTVDGTVTGSGDLSTNNTGGSEAHSHAISADGTHTHTVDTRSPYYALCYIMKT